MPDIPPDAPLAPETDLFVEPQNPLPVAIQQLPRDETVCRYCGIPYLIHSEMSKMMKEVRRLEGQLDRFPHLVEENRSLAIRLADLTNAHNELEQLLHEQGHDVERLTATLDHATGERAQMKRQLAEVGDELAWERSKAQRVARRWADVVQRHSIVAGGVRQAFSEQCRMVDAMRQQVPCMLRELADTLLNEYTRRNTVDYYKWTELVESERANAALQMEALRAELHSTVQQGNAAVDALTLKIDTVEAELQEMTTKEQSTHASLINAEKQCATLEGELTAARQHAHEKEATFSAENEHLSANIAQLSHSLLVSKRTIQELETEKSTLEADLAALHRRTETLITSSADEKMRALQNKDAEIVALTKEMVAVKRELRALQDDHNATIEAHQSRVKQLQAHHLEQLQTACSEESSKIRDELTASHRTELDILTAKHEATLQEERIQAAVALQKASAGRQADLERLRRELELDMRVVERKLDAQVKEHATREQAWHKREQDLLNDLASTKSSLETLRKASKATNVASTELLARDAEIAALKETIRLECEERNELMERLERMSVAGVAADMAGLVASKKEKSPSSRVTSSVATASLAEKSPEEVAFETLMEKRRRSSHKHPVQKRV